MTNTSLPDEVLKTDTKGRVRTPKARREALLEEFERSGVSGKKFATLVGVNYQTFASWVQQRRKVGGGHPVVGSEKALRGGGSPEALRLIEVIGSSAAERGEAVLWIQLPGGAQVEIQEANQVALVAELLRTLAARAC